MIQRDYHIYKLIPVRVNWFNKEAKPELISFGIHRFRQSLKIGIPPGYHKIRETIFTTLTINLKTEKSCLWHNLRESYRNEINKIQHKIDSGETIQIRINYGIQDFIELANLNIRLKNYRNKLTENDLMPYLNNTQAELLSAYVNNKLLAGQFYLIDAPEKVRVLYGYNARNFSPEQSSLCSCLTKYLHWYAILRYQEKGIECFDFGGINRNSSASTFGISCFKQGFGGTIIQSIDYEIASNRILRYLYPLLTYKKEFRQLART